MSRPPCCVKLDANEAETVTLSIRICLSPKKINFQKQTDTMLQKQNIWSLNAAVLNLSIFFPHKSVHDSSGS